jgi:chromosome segregation ATPase
MKNLMEKLQEKELQIEALRAQIAKLERDIETLQNAARILADEEEGNPLMDMVAPELSGKAAAVAAGDTQQKSNNGFEPQAAKKKSWP